jgi:hypothetical protein
MGQCKCSQCSPVEEEEICWWVPIRHHG